LSRGPEVHIGPVQNNRQKVQGPFAPDARPAVTKPFSLSIVSCAYNEEGNIAQFLKGCLNSVGPSFSLREVIVVASGCTDRTVELARELAGQDPRIRLVIQPTRLGKVSALTTGLALVTGDIVLVEDADTVPAADALEQIARVFFAERVSYASGHLVPVNVSSSFGSRLSKTFWDVHHQVALITPKASQPYAMRRWEFDVPADVQDDDTYMGTASISPGSMAVYASNAIFFNRATSTFPDFLRYRWRVDRHQLALRGRTGIQAVGWSPEVMVRALRNFVHENPGSTFYAVALGVTETIARIGAFISAKTSKEPMIQWNPIQSTKGRVGP
jgi:poly-beta-1,6-N-acetyl-D-glucosamine synthase